MTGSKPNPIVRLLPSLTDVAFLMPIVFLFFRMEGATRMLEGDTGWHIRTGEWILANWRVPDSDFFSFSKPGEQWFAWEWLWDAVFAWLHSAGGMSAVVLASVLVLCLTFALLFRLVQRKSGNVLIAIAVTLLAIATSAIHWWARPHMFTLLFTVIFFHILERKRDGETSRLWLLPILTVVWTNLHGGFFVGIILIGCYAAGELATALLDSDSGERRAALRRGIPYGLSGLGCFLATFINPYTYHLHLHILQYLGDPNSPFFRWVGEWQSVSFHHMAGRYFEWMIILGVASGVWSLYRRRFVYAILLAGWLHLGLISGRHIPIFALVAAPVIGEAAREVLGLLKSADLAGWVRRVIKAGDDVAAEIGSLDRLPRVHAISIAVVLAVGAAMFAPNPSERFLADFNSKDYPTEAVNALGPAKLSGDVLTNDEWSDYLIYRLYPTTKVFVDGRFDFYGAEFTEEYLNMMNVKHDWEETLKQHEISSVLLPVQASLASTLKESSRWRPVYDDGVAILFQAAASETAHAGEESSSIAAKRSGSDPDREVTITDDRDQRITQLQSERRGSL